MGITDVSSDATLDAAQMMAKQQNALREQTSGAVEEIYHRHRQFSLETTRFIAHRLSADQEVCSDVLAQLHTGKPDHAMRIWTEFLAQAARDYTAACARLAAIGFGAPAPDATEPEPAAAPGKPAKR